MPEKDYVNKTAKNVAGDYLSSQISDVSSISPRFYAKNTFE